MLSELGVKAQQSVLTPGFLPEVLCATPYRAKRYEYCLLRSIFLTRFFQNNGWDIPVRTKDNLSHIAASKITVSVRNLENVTVRFQLFFCRSF
jgi:hypothetical protein